jgi:hypothetical protein
MALSKELSREERIAIALDELNYRRLTYRGAEAKYGIPRSTLSDHVLGKVELGKKPGPPPVLTPEEEKYLIQWTIDMYEIGYGQMRRQVTEMVKKILDKDGRPKSF